MDKLIGLVNRAIADYGFRQMVVWNHQEVAIQLSLSDRETKVLDGTLRKALEELPVPVEPSDISKQEKRFEQIIKQSLKI